MNEQANQCEKLRKLVNEAQNREWPPGDWLTPLQDLMNNGSLFSEVAKRFPYPLIFYNRDGEVEMANDKLLSAVGLNDEDIKSGKISILNSSNEKLVEAMMLVFRRETTVVNGLKEPLDMFCLSKSPADTGDYKCAIAFPYIGDIPILYGITLFLPMEI